MTGKGAQVSRTVLSGMIFPAPRDPIVHDVTRLQPNQLFMGLAIFVSFLLGVEKVRYSLPEAGKFERYDWPYLGQNSELGKN